MFRRRAAVSEQFIEPLPSCAVGLYFTAEFTVVWTPLVSRRVQGQPGQVARHVVQQQAEQHSALMPVTRTSAAEHRVNAALGRIGVRHEGEVYIHTATAQLSAEPETIRIARMHENRLRDEELADQVQRHEFERVAKFRETVLSDAATAMSYWFLNHPDQLDEATYTKIERLVAKIAEHDPQQRWLQVAQVVDAFINDLTADDKCALLKTLNYAMSRFGHSDNAARISAILDRVNDDHDTPFPKP